MLSIIIPASKEAELTVSWAEQELLGVDHETLLGSGWAAAKRAKGDYICFLEKDCVLTGRYFYRLLEAFENKPRFRKLAMVSPAIGLNSYSHRLFGYRLDPEKIYPSYVGSSTSPYLVQAAYVPGAIIRRSSLNGFVPHRDNTVYDSINFCLSLWLTGQRIIMDPRVLYVSTEDDLDEAKWFVKAGDEPLDPRAIMDLFRRESVG